MGWRGSPWIGWCNRDCLQSAGVRLKPQAQSEGEKPDFFRLEETDCICRNFTSIVSQNDEVHLRCDDPKVKADWENRNRSMCRSDTFRRDDAIVLQLARAAFADSPGEIHFIPKRGKTLQSGRQAYFACKGQFVGINTARLECDLTRDIIQKMRYEGSHKVGIGISTVPSFMLRSKWLMKGPLKALPHACLTRAR